MNTTSYTFAICLLLYDIILPVKPKALLFSHLAYCLFVNTIQSKGEAVIMAISHVSISRCSLIFRCPELLFLFHAKANQAVQ